MDDSAAGTELFRSIRWTCKRYRGWAASLRKNLHPRVATVVVDRQSHVRPKLLLISIPCEVRLSGFLPAPETWSFRLPKAQAWAWVFNDSAISDHSQQDYEWNWNPLLSSSFSMGTSAQSMPKGTFVTLSSISSIPTSNARLVTRRNSKILTPEIIRAVAHRILIILLLLMDRVLFVLYYYVSVYTIANRSSFVDNEIQRMNNQGQCGMDKK